MSISSFSPDMKLRIRSRMSCVSFSSSLIVDSRACLDWLALCLEACLESARRFAGLAVSMYVSRALGLIGSFPRISAAVEVSSSSRRWAVPGFEPTPESRALDFGRDKKRSSVV